MVSTEMDVIYLGADGDQIYAFTMREDGYISSQSILLNGLTSTCVGVGCNGSDVVLVHKDKSNGVLWTRTMNMGL